MCFYSLWKNLRSRPSPSHYGAIAPITPVQTIHKHNWKIWTNKNLLNVIFQIHNTIFDVLYMTVFGQTFELPPTQHFKKGTSHMTEDGHISNCLMNKTIRYMAVFGHFIPSPALKGTFYMTEDGHISNCFVHQTIRYMTVFGHIKSAFFKMLGRGQFKGLTEEVIYRTSNIVLWIWNITFNKFLFVHIFHLCLWINWSGVIGAVATIMTWWRTTS